MHWAASSDDVVALDALLDSGADIEARGAVIGGGTALSDAAAFGQWNAARRLIERGASPTFWEAATMGLLDRVRQQLDADPPVSTEALAEALWGACHGNQAAVANMLLGRGADIDWIGWDELTPLDAARRSGADELAEMLVIRGAHSTDQLRQR